MSTFALNIQRIAVVLLFVKSFQHRVQDFSQYSGLVWFGFFV